MQESFVEAVAIITSPVLIGVLLLVASALIFAGCLGVKNTAGWLRPVRVIPTLLGGVAGAIAAINIYIATSVAEPKIYRHAETCVAEAIEGTNGPITYGDLGRAVRDCED